MTLRGSKARTFVPALVVLASAGCLLGATVLGQTNRKPPPRFPLTLFAEAKAEDYVDDQVCGGCHPDVAAEFGRSYHAAHVKDPKLPVERRGCQACHGPGQKHLDSISDPEKIGQSIIRYTRIKSTEASAACLRCHGATMHDAQWRRTEHARSDVGCVDCHTVHHGKDSKLVTDAMPPADDLRAGLSPTDVTATRPLPHLKAEQPVLCAKCHRKEVSEFRRNFHHPVTEGRMTCSDCHELHPTKQSPSRIAPVKSTCVRCHLEKAGPFKFEHDPVAGWTGEGCTECHRPHGSANPRLLNSFSRGLCAQCHSEMTTAHYPGQTCWASGCHEALHGSNGDRYLRTR